jgi:hypothetical protein
LSCRRIAPRRSAFTDAVLARHMEVLNALIRKADGWSLLLVHGWASLYADDLVVFISPSATDLQVARRILDLFCDASGLGCNLAKC